MAINQVTLNGKSGDASVAAAWIQALNDECIVREKAGFLFKASLDGDHLMLAAAPCLINGERTMHYNMHLEKENVFTLIGAVNALGVFCFLFNPESREQVAAQADEYVELFRRFAAFLIEGGYTGDGALDEVTQGLLEKLGLSPAPKTLTDLVKSRRS
jgi:hypothetical protein